MTTVTRKSASPLPAYHQDAYAWAMATAERIRQGRLDEIDLQSVAEEIESMGVSQRNELKNRLRVLLLHLFKWEYQPEARSSGWIGTITEQRNRLVLLLEDSPSLGRLLDEALASAYLKARKTASLETGLGLERYPEHCPYTTEQLLDDDFWPGDL